MNASCDNFVQCSCCIYLFLDSVHLILPRCNKKREKINTQIKTPSPPIKVRVPNNLQASKKPPSNTAQSPISPIKVTKLLLETTSNNRESYRSPNSLLALVYHLHILRIKLYREVLTLSPPNISAGQSQNTSTNQR